MRVRQQQHWTTWHKFLLVVPILITFVTVKVISEYSYLEQVIIAEKSDESESFQASISKLNVNFGAEPAGNKTEKPKLILFGSKWWFEHYPYLKEAGKMCPKCTFTEDMNLFDESDAVIFNGLTLPRIPPKRRPPNQIWIWFILEAPDTRWDRHNFAENYDNLFNWTMTYRRDSDIFVPYGEVIHNEKMQRPNFSETWAFMPSDVEGQSNQLYNESVFEIPTVEELKGRKMVAWIASNCRSPSRREIIVKALRKYIPVDIYGYCGTMECQFERPDRTASGNLGIDCRLQMSTKYKFYLALENSLCEDYVTEKYFDTLYTQMIPIAYGGANYSHFAPQKSYINVADFENIEDLANYLKFLDNHPEEFLKYFEWKKHFWVKNNGFVSGYCELCEKLWAKDMGHTIKKSYANIKKWWFRRSEYSENSGIGRGPSCTSYKSLLKKLQIKI